jgi:hypothetical protein
VSENEIQDFLFAKKRKNQNFHHESARNLRLVHITIPTPLARSRMSSMSGNTPQVPVLAISSNFSRRVHVVWGCRKIRISPADNRKSCDRQWMSSSIQLISNSVFRECKLLSWAAFEAGSQLSEHAKEAFRTSGLTSIHLPASVTVIGDDCFSSCRSLVVITFESGSQLSQLETRAFCESGLTSIHLPASVTVIGESCFCRCESLASITFDPASQLQEIRRSAFRGVPVEALILPGGIRHLPGSAFAETRLETLSFSPLSMTFTVCDSIVQDISGRCLIRYFRKGDSQD